MPETIFSAKSLTKVYTSGEVKVHALRRLDLEIRTGEIVVLLGPSGSGKSTLLNIMGGLDRATEGQLFFRDIELSVLDDRDLTTYRRKSVGFVFQFYNLVPSLTRLSLWSVSRTEGTIFPRSSPVANSSVLPLRAR
jgi:putative ABC transport system ATP-binding protein